MKTLLLTNEYPPNIYGGAGVHVEHLARALAQLIDVDVRCFGEPDAGSGRLRARGYGVDTQVFAATAAELRSPLQALERCIRFVADPTDADVVHCHTWYTHFGGIAAKTLYGLPLVITAHSLEPLREWKREQLGRGYDMASWVERTALEMADAVVAVSRQMKHDIVRLFAVEPNRVHVIYNGIDTEEWRPLASTDTLTRYGIDPEVPYVLFVGRITRQKGIIHLVNAVRYLDPATAVVLCAGAPDTAEIGAEVAAAVRAVQVDHPHVVWIPEMLDRLSLIELYSHAAVFCCPSIYEPFGIINLEAMACRTPVVGSAVGGIPEVVVDGETGFLVEVGSQGRELEPLDPELFERGFAEATRRLLADETLRRRMGAAGRARVVEHFAWPAIAREVVRLYERLLA
jgi:starch synthase